MNDASPALPPRHMRGFAKAVLLTAALCVICQFACCAQEKITAPPAGINGWPNKAYDKVVGYQFANFNLSALTDLADAARVISFIPESGLDLTKLKELKRKEVVLSAEQAAELLKLTFDSKKTGDSAFCYDPHHIFVFYAKDKPVGAIEICFHCGGARCWPENKAIGWHTSFDGLEKLSKSLGLGNGAPPADKR